MPVSVLPPAHLRAALNGAAAGVFTFDTAMQVLFRSDRLGPTLGISSATLPGLATVLELLEGSSALDRPAIQRAFDLCLAVDAETPEQRFTLETLDVPTRRSFAVVVVRLEDGTKMAAFEDVTVRCDNERRALELAMSDALTGLPNRQLFKTRVTAALQQASDDIDAQLAVMLVDLDRFKTVNDTLGHPVGDALLKLVAKRLRSVVRQSDIVARLGGDEFAVLITSVASQPALTELATRIVDMLARPYLVEGHLVTVGASVGLALAPVDARDHDRLLRCADLALYEAKGSGLNRHAVFRPEMDVKALARRALEIDLRRALALRQFELFYQPQIDLETRTVTGFEALIRWRHPERGLVSPADFIPLAEEIGLIVHLGEWVMREACQQAVQWSADLSVSVNVSPLQFEDTDRLLALVSRILAGTGLAGRRLEVEITESVLLRNEATVHKTLHALRDLGVRVAMDDFGTGYSSLSQLQSFPFDKIKIDRSFVHDRMNLEGQDAVIRAITTLGDSLGMVTIAEGVETAVQLDRIRSGGCTSVQGYLFSKPVPAADVERLIQDFSTERPFSLSLALS